MLGKLTRGINFTRGGIPHRLFRGLVSVGVPAEGGDAHGKPSLVKFASIQALSVVPVGKSVLFGESESLRIL